MGNLRTIDSFFKRKTNDTIDNINQENKRSKSSPSGLEQQQNHPASPSGPEQQPNLPHSDIPKVVNANGEEIDVNSLERDPGKRKQMWEHSANEREKVRRAYMNMGPFQIKLKEYLAKGSEKHPRRFQYRWFSIFPNWLEYSPTTHASYCFLCFLFGDKPNAHHGSDAFTVKGFDNWKKVNDGKKCAFLKHLGSSHHRNAVAYSENLLNQKGHIANVIEKQSAQNVLKNRIRLKASIDIVRWLTFQACAFRGHDETPGSKNRGNFLEMLKLLASYNDDVANAVLEKAHFNSKYTSGLIQKEILSIIANNVRKHIRSEVADSYFCVMVDEARDESKQEQMAIVLRFVDKDGFIRERFLDLVHVLDTSALTLKTSLWEKLLKHEFDTSRIRGQGYDGASNMRGEWNGLQALVIKDCPCAYYVHCFAHRLQLALVAASKEVIPVHQFFTKLSSIVNVICASSKRHDELLKAKSIEIERLLELGEIKTGRGENQVGMREVMGKTDSLSKALQRKSQDIGNAIELVSATKESLNKYRNSGWVSLLDQVTIFCEKHQIELPDMKAPYKSTRYRPRRHDNQVNVEHYYRVDIFLCTLDQQLHELDNRFNDQAIDLLKLSSALVPKRKDSEVFDGDKICALVKKYYPTDFTEQERILLRYQLELLDIAKTKNSKLSGISTLSELCRFLVETEKCEEYFLLDRLIRLILTLPVSTATTERAFSAMKLIKNRLRNRMSDEFLASNLVVYIEREIAEQFDSCSLIEEFKNLKGRRAEL